MNRVFWLCLVALFFPLASAPAGEAVPDAIRKLQDAKKFVYKTGGGDPMATKIASPEPESEEKEEPPAPPEDSETAAEKTAADLFAEFSQLNLRVDDIFQSPGAPTAIINGRLHHNGDVLSQERPEGDLSVDSIEPHGVLFKFKTLLVHLAPM